MRKIFYLLWALMPFCITACDNDDVIETSEEKLSAEVKQHLKDYYADAKIKSFHNWWNNSPFGTEVNLIDKDGNDVSIFYYEFKELSLTVTKYANIENLPLKVKYAFLSSPYGNIKKENIRKIERDDYAQLPNKMYRFEFTSFVPGVGDLYTLLTFNDDGYMLPVNHGFVNQAWSNPLIDKSELEFIDHHYGADIRSYENLGGSNCYYVIDHSILKKVNFRDSKWQSTLYPLPLDTDVPSEILKQLYELEPDFKYVQLNRVETPNGAGYQFLNEKGDGYTLGEMFVKRSL